MQNGEVLSVSQKRALLLRILLIACVIALVLGLVYFAFVRMMPGFVTALRHGDEAEIEAYISQNAGWKGMACVALLQFLQVISIALPGMPIQFAAGIVYGIGRGFLLCHLAYLAANVTVFCMARHLGSRVCSLVPMETQKSRLDFIRKSKYPAYVVALACVIPVLPNGIVPYVASGTKIKAREFALAVYCGSFFPVLATCAIGNRVIAGDIFLAILIFAISLVAVILLTLYRNHVIRFGLGIAARLSRSWNMGEVK